MKDSDFKQLNIICIEHDKVWAYCPFHKDVIRPNLSISLLDKYYGRYKCWACPNEGYLSKEQMNELNLSCSIVHKNDEKNLLTRWKQFNESCYDNLQKFPLLKLGLAKQLNVSIKSLDAWSIGYDGISFTVPMFRKDLMEYLSQSGFCGVQRRFADGTKRCVTGSRLGLMYPRKYVGDYYVFICEGFSDAISVWDLGLQSMARPHCRHIDGVGGLFASVWAGITNVVIIPDNDPVGIEGAEELQSILDGIYYEDEFDGGCEECIECTIFSFDGAKDVREYIKLRGKDYVRRELERYI